jgi:hypothetical protein
LFSLYSIICGGHHWQIQLCVQTDEPTDGDRRSADSVPEVAPLFDYRLVFTFRHPDAFDESPKRALGLTLSNTFMSRHERVETTCPYIFFSARVTPSYTEKALNVRTRSRFTFTHKHEEPAMDERAHDYHYMKERLNEQYFMSNYTV